MDESVWWKFSVNIVKTYIYSKKVDKKSEKY